LTEESIDESMGTVDPTVSFDLLFYLFGGVFSDYEKLYSEIKSRDIEYKQKKE